MLRSRRHFLIIVPIFNYQFQILPSISAILAILAFLAIPQYPRALSTKPNNGCLARYRFRFAVNTS